MPNHANIKIQNTPISINVVPFVVTSKAALASQSHGNIVGALAIFNPSVIEAAPANISSEHEPSIEEFLNQHDRIQAVVVDVCCGQPYSIQHTCLKSEMAEGRIAPNSSSSAIICCFLCSSMLVLPAFAFMKVSVRLHVGLEYPLL